MIRLAIRSQKLNQMERELKVGDATNAAMVSSSLQKHQRRDHGKDWNIRNVQWKLIWLSKRMEVGWWPAWSWNTRREYWGSQKEERKQINKLWKRDHKQRILLTRLVNSFFDSGDMCEICQFAFNDPIKRLKKIIQCPRCSQYIHEPCLTKSGCVCTSTVNYK